MAKMAPPSLTMKPVPIISDDDLAALLKACAGKEFNDRRDEALIRLLLDCGLRVSEACGLRIDQLDLDQGMAIVKDKGSKVRAVYFGARTARALDRYVRMRSRHRWAHLERSSSPSEARCPPMAPGSESTSAPGWPGSITFGRTSSATLSHTTS